MDMPAVPGHPVRWSTSDAVLVLLGAQLLSLLWAGVAITVGYSGDLPDPVPVSALVILNVGLWAGYGLGPFVVARARGRGMGADFGARWRWPDLPVGLVLGAAVQAAVLPALYWPIGRLVDGDPGESARQLVDGIRGPLDTVLLVVATAVMAPLVEELFYRGLLLRALQRRYGATVAVVASALVFALVHRDLLAIPGLFLFGVVAAVLALRSGRLGPGWAFHVGFNLTTLYLLGLF